MPSGCPSCHQKYARSGTYEKHLRTAQWNLDIVIESTVQYINNMETGLSHNSDTSGCQYSDCESDSGTPGSDPNTFYQDIA